MEHLGGWSNTGYLELDIQPRHMPIDRHTHKRVTNNNARTADKSSEKQQSDYMISTTFIRHNIVIRTVNGKEHLKGLKRTGGGVGSSKFDEGQKSIESFFKKRKVS